MSPEQLVTAGHPTPAISSTLTPVHRIPRPVGALGGLPEAPRPGGSPRADATSATESRPRATADSERPRVLVVDDDEAIRTLVRELLVDEGYAVLTAEDGAQALEALDGQEPDLILLDMRMPVMDGWAFASAYRERAEPSAPIVVITAATDARRTASEVNAAGYLGKPFDLDDLLAVVERTLEQPRD